MDAHARDLSGMNFFPIHWFQSCLDDKPIFRRNYFQEGFAWCKHGAKIPAVEADDLSTLRGAQLRPAKLIAQRGNSMSKIANLLARRMMLLRDFLILIEA